MTDFTLPAQAVAESAAAQKVLCPADFQLLARPFLDAIAFLFPAGLDPDFLPAGPPPEPVAGQHSLLLPLTLSDNRCVILRLKTEDGALAEKISDGWLLEQGESVVHILSQIRPAFIDSETGLYNARALGFALASCPNDAFFLAQSGRGKNLGETLQNTAEFAGLLRQYAGAPIFFCGYGLFAVLKPTFEGENILASARRSARLVQWRLKQEGLRCAQFVYFGAANAHAIFAESGLAGFQHYLDKAGKQGPFGLVCGVDLDGRERRVTRFRLVDNEVFHHLQRKWQGEQTFSIAIFRLESAPEGPSYVWVSQIEIQKNTPVLWMDDERTLVCFFPGQLPAGVADKVAAIRESLQEALPDMPISVGIAGFPCLDYPKKYTPANCFKALLHASLLGPGQMVVLDHLSLNVSGDSFFEEGDYRQAILEYRRGLRLKPDDVNLLNSLGVTLVAYGQENQATECFRQVLALEPNNHMALANLGYILLHKGRNVESLASLEKARAAFPPDEPMPRELLKSLVQLHLEQKNYEKALDVLAQWKTVEGGVAQDPLYHRQHGLALKGVGHRDEAMSAFEKALKLAPQDATVMAHLGELYRLNGEGRELGLHLCQQAVRLKRDDAELWRMLGDCYLDAGNLDAAAQAIEECLNLAPADAQGMWLAAQVYLQKKNIKRARYWLNRARKLHTISGKFGEAVAKALAGLHAAQEAASKAAKAGKSKADKGIVHPVVAEVAKTSKAKTDKTATAKAAKASRSKAAKTADGKTSSSASKVSGTAKKGSPKNSGKTGK